jgi:predicted amidophosphoribosyltransferase
MVAFCFTFKGDEYMQSAYPLSRCPACKKAFRMEIKGFATPPPGLGVVVCPHCGLKFQRFDPQYLKEPPSQATAR